MKATLIQRSKRHYADGLIEIVIWRVPVQAEPCAHNYKYRLVYIVGGIRVVGYDNEQGKGDHKHFGALETGYTFVNVATLLADFWLDVDRRIK